MWPPSYGVPWGGRRRAWSHLAWEMNSQFGLAPALQLVIGDLELPRHHGALE